MTRPAEPTPLPAFRVLIPARMASTRLPGKPLADLNGLPMVVWVAKRAELSGAQAVIVATDAPEVSTACERHGVRTVMTAADHPSGSDRLAEAVTALGWADRDVVVNVQGDEPLMDPALIRQVAAVLNNRSEWDMATAAHALTSVDDFLNPNVVKVVTDVHQRALYFSRAPIAWWRDGMGQAMTGVKPAGLPPMAPLRHIGLYAYRAGFLRRFPQLPPCNLETTEMLEQLRALWYGASIGVALADQAPPPGVDTPEDLERVRGWIGQRSVHDVN